MKTEDDPLWDYAAKKLRDVTVSLSAAERRVAALEELAHHLRHCRECGDTDVMECFEGRQMWMRTLGAQACEGCKLGLPLTKEGIHVTDTAAHFGRCTADRESLSHE
jgi:hypothetical protein